MILSRRVLVRDVKVFLFDETLSNLDAKLRSEPRVEIKRLYQKLKNTMIYVTHDQIEAMTLADRIAIMKGGVIQQLDRPHNIYNRPVNRFVASFIGSPAMNFIDGKLTGKDQIRFEANGLNWPFAGYHFAGTPITFRCTSEEELKAGQKLVIGFDPARGSLFEQKTGNRL